MVSLDVFVATSLALAAPWLYSLRSAPRSWSMFLSVLLLVHSLSMLHTLLVNVPPNLFSALNLPMNAATDTIRAMLLQRSDPPELSPEMEGLLRRLASFDTRSLYPRFGHNVLTMCTYCQSFNDFALYALPRPLLSYIREIAFIGLITLPSTLAAPLRKPAVAGLVLLALSEIYTLATVAITIPKRDSDERTTMWHDNLLILRHTVFLVLPLLTHYLPPILTRFQIRIPFLFTPDPPLNTPYKTQSTVLAETHQTLNHLLHSLHLLKYTHAATMRVPKFRGHAEKWWAEEAKVGGWIRGDGAREGAPSGDAQGQQTVRGMTNRLGLGFDEAEEGQLEGPLRVSAKMALGTLAGDGLRPSNHWHTHTHG
ncbi:hypothetical protein BDZ94DRAFT_1227195 [Collybia nuda]|uniref:Uncharacterized protein n=1 Tax=Collybia nuda TaxID=64659 RepID=A0A9P5XVR7_9AGAR|nr:hypothetical protein BDZ94DRAFT_1227195 [Collybia nuda]